MADPRNDFSLGAFGAIGQLPSGAERRTQSEPGRIVAETHFASVDLSDHENLQALAFEVLSSDPVGWNHGIALCLPKHDAQMSRRTQLTILGPDTDAISPSDRNTPMADLGLGKENADIYVRPVNTDAHSLSTGGIFEELNSRFSDHVWIFETAVGRMEVRQPSYRHIVPNLLSSQATHAATTPIPDGLVPVGYVFPPNPRRAKGVSATQSIRHYDASQDTMRRFGQPNLVEFKRKVQSAFDQESPPAIAHSLLSDGGAMGREERTCIRIAIRQQWWLRPRDVLVEWARIYDRPFAEWLG